MERGDPPRPSLYMESVPVSFVQPAVYPMPLPQQQANNEPSSDPRSGNPSDAQVSVICGFTLMELGNIAIQVVGVMIAAIFGAWAVKSYDSANVANQLSENALGQSNIANQLAQNALEQSLYANILSIINLCLSDQFRASIDCSAVLQAAPLASIIHGVIPSLTQSPYTPSQPPSSQAPAPPPQSTPATTSEPLSTLSFSSISTLAPIQTTEIPLPTKEPPTTAPGLDVAGISFGALVGIIIAVVIILTFLCMLLVRYRRARVAKNPGF